MEPVPEVDGVPLISAAAAHRRRAPADPPRARRASTSTATICGLALRRLDVGDELAGVQQRVDQQRRRLVDEDDLGVR